MEAKPHEGKLLNALVEACEQAIEVADTAGAQK
jgi:hypothetical protein